MRASIGTLLYATSASLLCVGVLACHNTDTPLRVVEGGVARRGPAAIQKYGCGSCHEIPGVKRADGMVGPPLIHFARRTFIGGEVPNTAEHLITWITVPQAIEPGTAMPNMGVTDEEARDIAAYLYTLR